MGGNRQRCQIQYRELATNKACRSRSPLVRRGLLCLCVLVSCREPRAAEEFLGSLQGEMCPFVVPCRKDFAEPVHRRGSATKHQGGTLCLRYCPLTGSSKAPQRQPLWSPFFNAECAVAVHSRPTLKPLIVRCWGAWMTASSLTATHSIMG